MQPAHAVPFLKAGRLVRVEEPHQAWGWGMVVNFHERKAARVRASRVNFVLCFEGKLSVNFVPISCYLCVKFFNFKLEVWFRGFAVVELLFEFGAELDRL